MALRQEFIEEIQVLDNASADVISPRIVHLLQWMRRKLDILPILADLKTSTQVSAILNGEDSGRYAQAMQLAGSRKEVAAIGLAMMEMCSIPTSQSPFRPFYGVPITFKMILPSPANKQDYTDAALQRYVRPLFEYILKQLPDEPVPVPANQSAVALTPVEIQESLKAFRQKYPNPENIAFVMMPFANTTAHAGIEQAIKATLKKNGFEAVLARDNEYHDSVWPNIQTYMHGCGFGIAVFERIQQENFNPNVSLEVGYMTALAKKLLLLKDQSLKALPTDIVGKLYRSFDVLDPAKTIPKQIEDWLREKGLISDTAPVTEEDVMMDTLHNVPSTRVTHVQLTEMFPFGYAVIYYTEEKRFIYVHQKDLMHWTFDWQAIKVEPNFATGVVKWTVPQVTGTSTAGSKITFKIGELISEQPFKEDGQIHSIGIHIQGKPVPCVMTLNDNPEAAVFALGFRIQD